MNTLALKIESLVLIVCMASGYIVNPVEPVFMLAAVFGAVSIEVISAAISGGISGGYFLDIKSKSIWHRVIFAAIGASASYFCSEGVHTISWFKSWPLTAVYFGVGCIATSVINITIKALGGVSNKAEDIGEEVAEGLGEKIKKIITVKQKGKGTTEVTVETKSVIPPTPPPVSTESSQ